METIKLTKELLDEQYEEIYDDIDRDYMARDAFPAEVLKEMSLFSACVEEVFEWLDAVTTEPEEYGIESIYFEEDSNALRSIANRMYSYTRIVFGSDDAVVATNDTKGIMVVHNE